MNDQINYCDSFLELLKFEENDVDNILNLVDKLVNTIDFVSKMRKCKAKRQIDILLKQINNKSITQSKKDKFIKKLNSDKQTHDITENLLLIVSHNIFDEKSYILGNILKDYINEEITTNEFIEYIEITNQLFVSDLIVLKNEKLLDSKNYLSNKGRLSSLGLLSLEQFNLETPGVLNIQNDNYKLTDLGNEYLKFTNFEINQ